MDPVTYNDHKNSEDSGVLGNCLNEYSGVLFDLKLVIIRQTCYQRRSSLFCFTFNNSKTLRRCADKNV